MLKKVILFLSICFINSYCFCKPAVFPQSFFKLPEKVQYFVRKVRFNRKMNSRRSSSAEEYYKEEHSGEEHYKEECQSELSNSYVNSEPVISISVKYKPDLEEPCNNSFLDNLIISVKDGSFEEKLFIGQFLFTVQFFCDENETQIAYCYLMALLDCLSKLQLSCLQKRQATDFFRYFMLHLVDKVFYENVLRHQIFAYS